LIYDTAPPIAPVLVRRVFVQSALCDPFACEFRGQSRRQFWRPLGSAL